MSEGDRQEFIRIRTGQLNEAREAKLAKEGEKYRNRMQSMQDFLRFFTVGRPLFYPLDMENSSVGKSFSVCLGIRVDLNSDKPFLASNMKLQVAISSSKKRIDVPLSKNKDVNAIMGASAYQTADLDFNTIKDMWQAAIRSAMSSDRGPAYIVTGNLLQSYGSADFGKGRLISYTTQDGKTLKGRLMPDGWEPSEVNSENLIKVPVLKALKVISSLTSGKSISLDNGAFITRTYNDDFSLMIPSSRSSGGDMYLDKELNDQMDSGRFDKVSNFMKATFSLSKITKVIQILQNNHNSSVGLLPYQLDLIIDMISEDKTVDVDLTEAEKKAIGKKSDERKEEDRIIVATIPEASPAMINKANVLRLRLSLKARAVNLKLKLAA